jgi:hypothetical protein
MRGRGKERSPKLALSGGRRGRRSPKLALSGGAGARISRHKRGMRGRSKDIET